MEQPLPPNGACLLGSFNLTQYVHKGSFDFWQLRKDIPPVVRAMDNIIDRTTYPLIAQQEEAKNKRRMGIGVTGLANAAEALGYSYASDSFITFMETVLAFIRDGCYGTSAILAKEKGAFPLYEKEEYLKGEFIKTLPQEVLSLISDSGIRNSHLLSIAPTGTISLTADNVSSGLEPPFTLEYDRTIQTIDGPRVERVTDYAYREWGIKGKCADEISVLDHVKVLSSAQKFIDSAVSKTCNVGDYVTFKEFKKVYEAAYEQGCKGITTFRAAGKRFGILNKVKEDDRDIDKDLGDAGVLLEPKGDTRESNGTACFYDPSTGKRSCE